MKRILGMILTTGLLAGVLAMPASAANVNDLVGVGVFSGNATVGKILTGACTNGDQSGVVSGGGLGLPVLSPQKHGWWKLDTSLAGTVPGVLLTVPQVLTYETQHLVACGRLSPAATLKKGALGVNLGAACGASSGHEGFGTITNTDLDTGVSDIKKLRNLGWATAVGGVLPVTGRFSDDVTKKAEGHVVALVVASGAGPCVTAPKAGSGPSKTGGATSFAVVGLVAFVN